MTLTPEFPLSYDEAVARVSAGQPCWAMRGEMRRGHQVSVYVIELYEELADDLSVEEAYPGCNALIGRWPDGGSEDDWKELAQGEADYNLRELRWAQAAEDRGAISLDYQVAYAIADLMGVDVGSDWEP